MRRSPAPSYSEFIPYFASTRGLRCPGVPPDRQRRRELPLRGFRNGRARGRLHRPDDPRTRPSARVVPQCASSGTPLRLHVVDPPLDSATLQGTCSFRLRLSHKSLASGRGPFPGDRFVAESFPKPLERLI